MREPPEIVQLDEVVANQIAAGEVVERPAAVVKELAENSIDAGATRIRIAVEDGGRRLVEIEDDGHGMRPDDLRRALGRHATSKLRSADDLSRIATLGFRGEALPSIASVCSLELASRPHGAAQGFELRLEALTERAAGPVGMAPGTRISVRNLFWNVPARLKFLKSAASESGHVHDLVERLALSHPHIAFRLDADGAEQLDLPAHPDLASRLRALYGAGFADGLLPVALDRGGWQLTGFVAHPREARPTAKRQFVFLNGRWVRDRLLVAAVREGYKGFLEPRLHAALVLHLDGDPSQVDVNVHPTKAEVRFRSEGEVFALLSTGIHQALAAHQGGFGVFAPQAPAARPIADGRPLPPPAPAPSPAPIVVVQERFLAPPPTPVAAQPAAPETAPPRVADAPAAAYDAIPHPATFAKASGINAVRRIIQLHDMFLLVETPDRLRLIDQHALHEKLILLRMDDSVGTVLRDGVQELAVAKVVTLTAAETAAVAAALPELARAGIVAERAGPTAIAITAHPAALKRMDWTAFLAGIAADGGPGTGIERIRESIRHRAACHAAIKAGQRLTDSECRELVEALYAVEGLEHCPHGRPTTLDLTWAELGRRFQR